MFVDSVCSDIAIFCIIWGSFIETSRLVVQEDIISSVSLEGLSIGVVSDFHVGFFTSYERVEKVVTRLNELEPDMVLIPGDFLYGLAEDFVDDLESLSRLNMPVFAILGNHDHCFKMRDPGVDLLRKKLKLFGVRELRNEAVRFSDNVWIVGVDDNYLGFDDLGMAFSGVPDDVATILIAHTPDIVQKKIALRANFIVAGHTHGGQIRMPWGSIPFVIPVKNTAQDQGLFLHKKLLVSSGVGESGTRVRFLNPPEIRLVHFVAE